MVAGGGGRCQCGSNEECTGLPGGNWSDLAGDGVVAGGRCGAGPPESSVGATKSAPLPPLSSLKNLGGGMWGGGHQPPPTEMAGDGVVAGGRRCGGGESESSVGAMKSAPLPNNWSDLAGDGVVAGGGGRCGGGTREQCGSNEECTGFPPLSSLKNLTTGPIWLVTGWRAQCSQGCAGSIH